LLQRRDQLQPAFVGLAGAAVHPDLSGDSIASQAHLDRDRDDGGHDRNLSRNAPVRVVVATTIFAT
jgi:hypothetical protein